MRGAKETSLTGVDSVVRASEREFALRGHLQVVELLDEPLRAAAVGVGTPHPSRESFPESR